VLPATDPAAYVADRIAAAPTRFRAVATIAAPVETVRARTWGGLPGRLAVIDAHTYALDLSGDSLARIAAILTGIDAADYTLDADPDVLTHLVAVDDRTRRAVRIARS
jgi:hypothetical protein